MKGLDIRFPIGVLFTILGVVLLLYGLVSDPSIYRRSLGININLWWGLLLTVAGTATLWLSRKRHARHKGDGQPAHPPTPERAEQAERVSDHPRHPESDTH